MFVKPAAEPLLDDLRGHLHVADQAVLTLHMHRHERNVAHRVRQLVGAASARMAVDRGGDNPWTEGVIERVVEHLEARFPSARREDYVLWRDRELMKFESDRSRRTSGEDDSRIP